MKTNAWFLIEINCQLIVNFFKLTINFFKLVISMMPITSALSASGI